MADEEETTTTEPTEITEAGEAPFPEEEGRSALEALLPRLLAQPEAELVQPKADVQVMALVARGVARNQFADPEGEVRRRFAALGEIDEYDDSCCDDLLAAADACWTAGRLKSAVDAAKTTAMLPPDVAAEATEVRNRMFKVAEYYLADHPVDAVTIVYIRAGSGYLDTMNDLGDLADLYIKYYGVLSTDVKYYRSTDLTDARRLVRTMMDAMGLSEIEGVSPTELRQRAWTFLNQTYDQVRRGATFLYWGESRLARDFPSLVSTARAKRPRKKKKEEPPTPPS